MVGTVGCYTEKETLAACPSKVLDAAFQKVVPDLYSFVISSHNHVEVAPWDGWRASGIDGRLGRTSGEFSHLNLLADPKPLRETGFVHNGYKKYFQLIHISI